MMHTSCNVTFMVTPMAPKLSASSWIPSNQLRTPQGLDVHGSPIKNLHKSWTVIEHIQIK